MPFMLLIMEYIHLYGSDHVIKWCCVACVIMGWHMLKNLEENTCTTNMADI